MIKAEEAWRKSVLHKELKWAMDEIEKNILKNIERGKFDVNVPCSDSIKSELLEVLLKELYELGYKAEYIKAKPLPCGCPPDQWYSEDYLHISWSKVEE
jgi:hypothetical protein